MLVAVGVVGLVLCAASCGAQEAGTDAARVKNAARAGATQSASGGASTMTTTALRSTTVPPSLPGVKLRKIDGSTTTTTAPVSPLGTMSRAKVCSSTAFACGLSSGNAPFVLLAFGDSYGSGEGNPAGAKPGSINWSDDNALEDFSTTDYASRTNFQKWWWDFETVGGAERPKFAAQGVDSELVATSWVCHRSSDSGIAKAVESLLASHSFAIKFGHFACSGAKSQHITRSTYTPGFNEYPLSVPTQIDQANTWLTRQLISKKDVDAVVVSIGGNDVGFADVIESCFIMAGACNNDDDMQTLFDNIPSRISTAVNSVVSAVQSNYPNAKIFFTAYTDGISVSSTSSHDKDGDGVCSEGDDPYFETVEHGTDEFWDLRADDAVFVRDVLDEINSSLASAINGKSNVSLIDAQYTNYRNNGFCTLERRNITFNDEAVARQGADQWHVSSGGWHPNDRGYGYYGAAIAAKFDAVFAVPFSR